MYVYTYTHMYVHIYIHTCVYICINVTGNKKIIKVLRSQNTPFPLNPYQTKPSKLFGSYCLSKLALTV